MLLDLLGGRKREPAECVITVGGREISEFYPLLTEVTVDCSRAGAATGAHAFREPTQRAGTLDGTGCRGVCPVGDGEDRGRLRQPA